MEAIVFTADFRRRGVLPILSGQMILRRNGVSTFKIEVDGNDPMSSRFEEGRRVVIQDAGIQYLAGPVESVTDDWDAGIRDISLTGSSDMKILSQRVTLPNPAAAATAQTVDAYYKRSGNAGEVITELVRLNAGQGALASRRSPLTVATSSAGRSVTVNSRFKPLLEEVQALATAGEVTFQTRQAGRGIVFEIVETKNRARAVRLTTRNGGILSYSLSREAPTVTDVIVAGQGEGTARTIRHVTGNASDWGTYAEVFQDRRDTDDSAELTQAGEETLADGQEKVSATFEASDTGLRRFGRDFWLGDTITLDLDGVTVTDLVQSAEITWGADGRTVKLQVGPTPEEMQAPAWLPIIRQLRRRATNLEVR